MLLACRPVRLGIAACVITSMFAACRPLAPFPADAGADKRDAGGIQNPTGIIPTDHEDGGYTPFGSAADKLDLLFIVDNSSSMREEQQALRREFPRMIRELVTGDHDADGKIDHQPVTDLHIGVVSSNMGADSELRGCEGLGDDGLLQHAGNLARDSGLNCMTSYPGFLSYARGVQGIDVVASDFGCIAALGTAGCGFEQHFESALKALWPASQPDLTFWSDGSGPSTGHGDRENAGFLRRGATGATLAVIAIADEDDCSTADRSIFQLEANPDAGTSYDTQPLNLRCYYNHDKAFPLDRYLFGFRHLGSRRVVFAGIVGVPVDLVDPAARSKVDFSNASARDGFYDKVLADPRMQEMLNPQSAGKDGVLNDLNPACSGALGRAYPARRFVEMAKRFGEDSLIQSICGASFNAPIDQVVERVSVRLD